ncbi:hypothetical protein HELRODRAFT_192359 [Helobdella robusta]|uniref:Protein kinase domain-containing protein n=1 Tax=Helobdella robusta TaxID=6412 RepID=T1FTV0_HELRO|nr:hypothetical protein HELRODRAFT_192359 [Helobdella robusta]ESO01039.1 hypothetical protein HELRODRAFT_192359 [Helobdella robusta]
MDDENHEGINYANFEYVKTLGKGTHGTVILAQSKINNKQYAIKSIKKQNCDDQKQLSLIKREVEIMANLNHPHIITVHDVCESSTRVTMTLEYACNGELFDYVNASPGGLISVEVRRLFSQIVSAVDYMHKKRVVHRDLKLENILLDANNDTKIADFGLASMFSRDKLMFTYCGSPLYASPEIIRAQPYYGPEVDCWSLGVILYAMSFGSMPFDGGNVSKLRKTIIHGIYNVPPYAPPALDHLIHSLLQPDADRRLLTKQISIHPWMLNSDADDDDYDNNDGDGFHFASSYDDRNYRNQNCYSTSSIWKPGTNGSCGTGCAESRDCYWQQCESNFRRPHPQYVDPDVPDISIDSQHFRDLLKQQLNMFSPNDKNFNNNNSDNNNYYLGEVRKDRTTLEENFNVFEFSKNSDHSPSVSRSFDMTQTNSSSYSKHLEKNAVQNTNQNCSLNVATPKNAFSLSKSPNSLCVNDRLCRRNNISPLVTAHEFHDDDDNDDDVSYDGGVCLNISKEHHYHEKPSPFSSFSKPVICEIKSPKKLTIASDISVIFDLKTSSSENLRRSLAEDSDNDDVGKNMTRHRSVPHNLESFKKVLSSSVHVVEDDNLILQCNNLNVKQKSYRMVSTKNKSFTVENYVNSDEDVTINDCDHNDDDASTFRSSDVSCLFHIESETEEINVESCNGTATNLNEIIKNNNDDDDFDNDDEGNGSYHFNDIDEVLNQGSATPTGCTATGSINLHYELASNMLAGDIDDDRYSVDSLDT